MILLPDIKVAEFTKGIAGPYAGMIFADLGAEVVKVEPLKGDPTRNMGSFLRAATFVAYNRNKKSLTVNLRSEEGKTLMFKLLESCDIFVESWDPGVAEDLGFTYEEIAQVNRKIIYVSIKSSVSAQYRDEPISELMIEARSWCTAASGDKWSSDQPCRPSWPVFSCATGIYAAIGAMGALLNRERTDEGEKIEVGILETAYMCRTGGGLRYDPCSNPAQYHIGAGGGAYNMFKTMDGWIFIAASGDKQWVSLCDEFGISEEKKWKFAGREKRRLRGSSVEVEKIIAEVFAKLRTDKVFQKLINGNIPGAPVTTMKEVVNDPHLLATKNFVPFTIDSETALTVEPGTFLSPMLPIRCHDYNPDLTERWTPPPVIGEHSVDIMRDLGYTEDQITKLQKKHQM